MWKISFFDVNHIYRQVDVPKLIAYNVLAAVHRNMTWTVLWNEDYYSKA